MLWLYEQSSYAKSWKEIPIFIIRSWMQLSRVEDHLWITNGHKQPWQTMLPKMFNWQWCFGNWKSPSFPTNLQISEFNNSQHNVKCLLGRLHSLNIIIPDIPTGVQIYIYIHLSPKISPCKFSQRFRFYLAPSATSSPEDLRKVMKRSQSLSVPPFQPASLARFARFPSPNVIKGKAPKKHKTHKLEAGSQAAKRPLCSIRNPEMKCKLALRIGHALHMTHPQHDSWDSLSPP